MNGIPIKDKSQYLKIENKIPTPSNFSGVANSEKRKIMAASRVPIPPNVIGIDPIKIAMGILATVNSKGTLVPTA